MKSIAADALLALLAIALTHAVAEVALRVVGYPPRLTEHAEFMRRDPVLGWALRPGVAGTYVSDEPIRRRGPSPVRPRLQHLQDRGTRLPRERQGV